MFVPAFGRVVDEAHTEAFFARMPQIKNVCAEILSGEDTNRDIDLCDIYVSVTGKPFDSLNQNPRGFCVGFNTAKTCTLELAMQAFANEISWPGADVAVEPIYGGSRFEIGYQKYRSSLYRGGDGSVGTYAAGIVTGKQIGRAHV